MESKNSHSCKILLRSFVGIEKKLSFIFIIRWFHDAKRFHSEVKSANRNKAYIIIFFKAASEQTCGKM